MTSGCVADRPPDPPPAQVVDLAPLRCPETPEDWRQEFDRGVERPKPDVKLPDGKMALSRARARRWIDDLEGRVIAKNAAGHGMIEAYERCRSGTAVLEARS